MYPLWIKVYGHITIRAIRIIAIYREAIRHGLTQIDD